MFHPWHTIISLYISSLLHPLYTTHPFAPPVCCTNSTQLSSWQTTIFLYPSNMLHHWHKHLFVHLKFTAPLEHDPVSSYLSGLLQHLYTTIYLYPARLWHRWHSCTICTKTSHCIFLFCCTTCSQPSLRRSAYCCTTGIQLSPCKLSSLLHHCKTTISLHLSNMYIAPLVHNHRRVTLRSAAPLADKHILILLGCYTIGTGNLLACLLPV
jgi:hypothetical protein